MDPVFHGRFDLARAHCHDLQLDERRGVDTDRDGGWIQRVQAGLHAAFGEYAGGRIKELNTGNPVAGMLQMKGGTNRVRRRWNSSEYGPRTDSCSVSWSLLSFA